MNLSAPRVVTWWVSVILGVVGLLLHLNVISAPGVTPYAFWFLFVGFVLLVLGSLFKGM